MGKEILVIDNNKPLRKKPFAFTPQVIDQIEKLASLMCTLSEIGDIIGCSHDTIQRNQEAKDRALAPIKQAFEDNKEALRDLWQFTKDYLVPLFEFTLVRAIEGVGRVGFLHRSNAVAEGGYHHHQRFSPSLPLRFGVNLR